MPDLTTNYGFKKPKANEYASPNDFNDNWDALDSRLKEMGEAEGGAIKTHNESDNPHPGKFAPKTHGHAASEVTAGTLGGAVKANMAATADISVSQVRDIMFGTGEITAGSASTEPEGSLHFVIE